MQNIFGAAQHFGISQRSTKSKNAQKNLSASTASVCFYLISGVRNRALRMPSKRMTAATPIVHPN
jgi:hypothetical protein